MRMQIITTETKAAFIRFEDYLSATTTTTGDSDDVR